MTEGTALIPIFNKLGYDLMLPGNWEVVYKKKQMLFDMGHSNAAKICANMFHRAENGDRGESIFRPWTIRETGGIRIGIIGYTDHLTPRRQPPAFSAGIAFEHPSVTLASHIKTLRQTERCEVVVVVTHIGLAQQVGLANNPACEGADFIIGADTHERVRVPIRCRYAQVVECGAFGSFAGRLTLEVTEGKISRSDYELIDADPQQIGRAHV